MLRLFYSFNSLLSLLMTTVVIYWLGVSFFGLRTPKARPKVKPSKRFLILVPAHDEEVVIGALVENLTTLDYPRELYDVYVIADNCEDDTAAIARAGGAKALEHFYGIGEPKGKPYAIAWALRQLDLNDYDGVAFFDADNLVERNFLSVMNDHLHAGDRLMQCYLDTKNPTDNWVTLTYAAAYYYMNRAWQVAKTNIGLPVSIGGTGFCVDASLLQEIGWKARTLTEDLEFQMQCLLAGVKAVWSHETRIYDEKPLDFKASIIQRLRWARGHWQVCFRYFPRLLRSFFRQGDVGHLDGAIYLLNTAQIVAGLYLTIVSVAQTVLNSLGYAVAFFPQIMPGWVVLALLAIQFVYMWWCLKLDTKLSSTLMVIFPALFLYNIIYMPLFVWALFTCNDTNWRRTEHVRSLQVHEVSNLGD